MRTKRNIKRFWVDEASGILVREWNDEEYKNINPHTRIFEKYWSYYCPICGFIPLPNDNREHVEREAKTHQLIAGSEHTCIVEFRKHELGCMENREEFLEDSELWVSIQEKY